MTGTSRDSNKGPGALARIGGRVLRTKRLMRAPIWIYRARLGFVFGSRMLMLEHIGRKSGQRRYVVLEVFGHPTPDTYVVPSGFGTRSQWFRNIQANPHVRVHVGSRAPAEAVARRLDPAEADASLRAYIERRPRAWERFKPVVENTLEAPIDDEGTNLPLVELRLTDRH